jgi:hypothetical protein
VCSTVYDPERQPRARRGGAGLKDEPTSRPKVSKVAVAGAAAGDVLDDADPDEDNIEESEADGDGDNLDDLNNESEDLIEDTSDLGEDGDDIGEVMEHIDEDIEDKT